MEYGFSDGIGRMWDAARRIVTGYDPKKYPQDKAAKDNLEKAVETPTSEIIGGDWQNNVLSGDWQKNGLLFVGVILLIIMVFKD